MKSLEKILFEVGLKVDTSLSPIPWSKSETLPVGKLPTGFQRMAADTKNHNAFKRGGKPKNETVTPEQKEAVRNYTIQPSSLNDEEKQHIDNYLRANPTQHEGHVYRGFHSPHQLFLDADKKAGHPVEYVDIQHPNHMSSSPNINAAANFGEMTEPGDDYYKYLPKNVQNKKGIPDARYPDDRSKDRPYYEGIHHLLRLKVPQGSPGHYIDQHSEFHSDDPYQNMHRQSTEDEVLFPRGTTVRIHRTPTFHSTTPGFGSMQRNHGHVTWHGEVLPYNKEEKNG